MRYTRVFKTERMHSKSWFSSFNPFSSPAKLLLVTSSIVLSWVVGLYVVLLALWLSGILEPRSFSLRILGTVQQLVTVLSQAIILALTALICYLAEKLFSDLALRRREPVAAMEDGLSAWRGLGSSLMTLWRGRKLVLGIRTRIAAIAIFFLAISTLQIVTPTAMTVETVNRTLSSASSASLLRPSAPIMAAMLNFTEEGEDAIGRVGKAFGALPYVWSQRDAGLVGSPPGLNGTIFYSPLDAPGSSSGSYVDTHARLAWAACASPPASPLDALNFTFEAGEKLGSGSDLTSGILGMSINISSPTTSGGTAQFSQSTYAFNGAQLGGEKENLSSPPAVFFPDTLLYLYPLNDDPPPNTVVWALLSVNKTKLVPDGASVLPPLEFTLDTMVWSWLKNTSLTQQEEEALAYTEPLSLTFYVWPITCAFTLLSGTATVNGANQLLSFSSNDLNGTDLRSPFNLPTSSDPLVQAWGGLITSIQDLEFGAIRNVLFSLNFMENFLVPVLNSTATSSTQTERDSLATSADRFSAFGDVLRRMTAIAYALLLESLRSPATTAPSAPVWNPPTASIIISQPELHGRIRLNGLQIVVGLVSALALVACFVHALGLYEGAQRETLQHEDEIVGGNALDLVTLLRGSTLPEQIYQREENGDAAKKATRRLRAEEIVAEIAGGTLDAVKDRSVSLDELESFPVDRSSDSDHQPSDYAEMTEKILFRAVTAYAPPSNRTGNRLFWRSTMMPFALLTGTSLLSLAVFHLVLLAIWAETALDQRFFDVDRIASMSQITGILTQAFSVLALTLLCWTVQKLASDQSIRYNLQTMANLSDSLSAWSGLAAASAASIRQVRSGLKAAVNVAKAMVFFASVALLHITVPSVFTVEAANDLQPLSVKGLTTPGVLNAIGYDRDAEGTTDALNNILSSSPYLWSRRNSTRLPAGYNETAFFTTPETAQNENATFIDRNSFQLDVQCGIVPRSFDGNESYSVTFTPAPSAAAYQNTTISFSNFIDMRLTDGAYASTLVGVDIEPGEVSYQLGGPKASTNDPPVVQIPDLISYAVAGPGLDAFEYGTTYLGYWSLRNDTLHIPPNAGYAPPVVQAVNVTVWSWINDTSLSSPEQLKRAYKENTTLEFYFYALGCSLFVNNATTYLTGDSVMINSTVHANQTPDAHSPTPFLRPLPSTAIERSWWDLIDAMGDVTGDWIFGIISESLAAKPGLATIEDVFRQVGALHYALIFQDYQTRVAQGDSTVNGSWVPGHSLLTGTVPVVRAHLVVNGLPLLLGLGATALLIAVTIALLWGHDLHDSVMHDGGLLDMMGLVQHSSLPAVLGAPVYRYRTVAQIEDDEEVMVDWRTRRKRAEETLISYDDGTLHIHEQAPKIFRSDADLSASRSSLPSFPSDQA